MLIAVSGLAACSGSNDPQTPGTETQTADNGVYFNQAFDRENMKTIRQEPYVIEGNDNIVYEKTLGLGIELTKELTAERNAEDSRLGLFITPQMIGATYLTDAAIAAMPSDETLETMTEEEIDQIYNDINHKTVYLFAVLKINGNSEEDAAYFDKMMEKYQKADVFYTADGYTYYFAYSDDMSGFEISDSEQPALAAYIDSLGTINDDICLFTPEERVEPDTSAENFEGTLKDFSTVSMTGEAVDASIFADYDITMVNLWATWCSACVEEMPELQELYTQLPENINLISICSDAASETELAQKMIDELGIEFTTLMDSESLLEGFIDYCSAYPTTVFVDSQGNIVGELVVGVPNGNVIAMYSAMMDVALQCAAQ
jgi:thiol-disulfide isomerase/thioredoxin